MILHIFKDSEFNGDISKWDVSGVSTKNMEYIFKSSPLEKNPPVWYKS